MANKQIPIYLFTGFLEAGKTRMIQESLEDPAFNKGEATLLLVFEEGEETYAPTRFAGANVTQVTLESEEELTADLLLRYQKQYDPARVVVEYNGMWQLNTLYESLPENWFVFQQLLFADAGSFSLYNANMRSLVVDKLQNAEMVIFNRAENADREALHKLVRGVSRRAVIAYESATGELEYDDIEDPLPFDIHAPVIRIEDRDYAIWYRDMADALAEYHGKTVKFKGMLARDRQLGGTAAVIGRHVMTCCEDDIAFHGLVCQFGKEQGYKTGEWIMLTARISIEAHPLYGQEGPVLYATDVALTSPPKPELATFY